VVGTGFSVDCGFREACDEQAAAIRRMPTSAIRQALFMSTEIDPSSRSTSLKVETRLFGYLWKVTLDLGDDSRS